YGTRSHGIADITHKHGNQMMRANGLEWSAMHVRFALLVGPGKISSAALRKPLYLPILRLTGCCVW
ncbi:MAG TPA: hypothetical protein VK638_52595, partial [Edaphobacter sp.]|nr:hypothetical protein [Edaphobacter sp.]